MPITTIADLTAEAFAPYGDVFLPSQAMSRTDQIATLQNGRDRAKPNLFMSRSGITSLPHSFRKMEVHPFSSQTFIPFGDASILVAAAFAGPDGQPDLSTLKAFLTRNGQGFSYKAGTWHIPIACLGTPTHFVGFMYEDGTPQDCVWADVPEMTLAQG